MKNQFINGVLALMFASNAFAQTGTTSGTAGGTSGSTPMPNPSVSSPAVSGGSSTNNSPTTVTTPAGMNPTSTSNATTNNMDWNSQNIYWRDAYSKRPYYSSNRDYSVYEPAYQYGVELYNQNPHRRFEDLNQSQIGSGWANARGKSDLGWTDAQQATRDAYNRMYEAANPTKR